MLQDTVATEIMGEGKYMVHLTLMINGFVAISNNVVQAIVTRPLYDRSPVSIYGISRVLMPVDLPHPTSKSFDASSTVALSFYFSFFLLLVI
jgi:hypothetical protein